MKVRHGWALAAGAAAVLGGAPNGAHAQDARSLSDPLPSRSAPRRPLSSEPDFAFDALVDVTLPTTMGARFALEVPGHVVIHVVGGCVTSAFVDAINDVGTGWGAWDVDDAAVLRTLVGNATWLELGLGLRPAGTPGIEVAVGYVLIWSHQLVTPTQMGLPVATADVGLDVSIHAVHGEIAWQTAVGDWLSFRLALGWVHAFSHDVSLVTDSSDDELRAALESTQAELAGEVGRRAFGPTLTLGVGVRLR